MKTKLNARKSIISVILAVIMICSLFMISGNALIIDNKTIDKVSSSYSQFLHERATNEKFAQAMNAAEELGIEFFDINELNFSEEEMKNLLHFDSEEEFLAFVENIQRQNTIVISESEILNSIDDNIMVGENAAASTMYTTLTKFAPNLITGLLNWQNISVQYSLLYNNGRPHIYDVNVLHSWYTNVAGFTRSHSYGYFHGQAVAYPEALVVPYGTVYAVGIDFYGVEILGTPIGISVEVTFNMELYPYA